MRCGSAEMHGVRRPLFAAGDRPGTVEHTLEMRCSKKPLPKAERTYAEAGGAVGVRNLRWPRIGPDLGAHDAPFLSERPPCTR